MSLFGTILSKIFPANHPAVTGAAQASPAGPAATPGASTTTTMPTVDVEAILNDMAKKNPQKLNWQTSIVDLMKLLGLDSSLSARKALAQELHYTGDTNDSATMNMWLQKQVMNKLAQNGGKVPEDLKQ